MEKQYAIFIGIVAIIVAITLVFFYMNGMVFPTSLQTGGQGVTSNPTFKAETSLDGNYLTFRYTPDVNITGPVTAAYQVQKNAKALFNDKKIFESVSPDNPIEIVLNMSDKGNYTVIMLISDNEHNLLHQSSTTWSGVDANSSANAVPAGIKTKS